MGEQRRFEPETCFSEYPLSISLRATEPIFNYTLRENNAATWVNIAYASEKRQGYFGTAVFGSKPYRIVLKHHLFLLDLEYQANISLIFRKESRKMKKIASIPKNSAKK